QKQYADALQLCQKAVALKVSDTTEASACVNRVTPLLGRRFSAHTDVTWPGSGNSGQFASCAAGFVRAKGGKGIKGAAVEVSNGPTNKFRATTDIIGHYQLCGLGASTWSAVLIYIPGQSPLANRPLSSFYVNGNNAQPEAVVNFDER